MKKIDELKSKLKERKETIAAGLHYKKEWAKNKNKKVNINDVCVFMFDNGDSYKIHNGKGTHFLFVIKAKDRYFLPATLEEIKFDTNGQLTTESQKLLELYFGMGKNFKFEGEHSLTLKADSKDYYFFAYIKFYLDGRRFYSISDHKYGGGGDIYNIYKMLDDGCEVFTLEELSCLENNLDLSISEDRKLFMENLQTKNYREKEQKEAKDLIDTLGRS